MNEIHDRVRAALHDAVDAVPLHPDERDVARRTTARRRRRTRTRVVVVGAATAAAVAGMVVTNGPGLAERGTATVQSAPRSPASSTAPAATAGVASVPAGHRIVARVGRTLHEISSTGEDRTVATLPEVPDVDPVLWAVGDRLIVTYLGRVLLYDTRTWATPLELGSFLNLGIVVTDDGFWAADVSQTSDADGVYRKFDWTGRPVGPATPALGLSLPLDRLDGGILTMDTSTGRVVAVTARGETDLGNVTPIASHDTRVALAETSGRIDLHDIESGTTRSIDISTHEWSTRAVRSHRTAAGSPLPSRPRADATDS